jgi:hypothetical protein
MDLIVEEKEIKKVRLDFAKAHQTYYNSMGQKVVGVTTALNLKAKQALIGWAYKRGKDGLELYSSRDKAADIGTIVHARIMGYFLGYEIDDYNISREAWDLADQSMQSFYEWARPRKVKPILVETQLVSEKYQFGGTPDVYGEMDDRLTLLDFKTGSGIYDDQFLQVAAYSQLLTENKYPHTKIILLNIPKSKGDRFRVEDASAEELALEFEEFLCFAKAWDLERQIKTKKKGGVI